MREKWFPTPSPSFLMVLLSKKICPLLNDFGQNKPFSRLLFIDRINIYKMATKINGFNLIDYTSEVGHQYPFTVCRESGNTISKIAKLPAFCYR